MGPCGAGVAGARPQAVTRMLRHAAAGAHRNFVVLDFNAMSPLFLPI
jgi:hypothetical protein